MANRITYVFVAILLEIVTPLFGFLTSVERPRRRHKNNSAQHEKKNSIDGSLQNHVEVSSSAGRSEYLVRKKEQVSWRRCNKTSKGKETSIVGDSSPGPGIICDKDENFPCMDVIGDECCTDVESWWCELEPMCNPTTPNRVQVTGGITPPIKGIFCPTEGEHTTCYEARAHRLITATGFFCPHDYFWTQHEDTSCKVTLRNPYYNGLRFAKAACIHAGSECWGVYDTFCDGYDRTYLCDSINYTDKLSLNRKRGHCVHQKLFREPGSYFSLCAEEGSGSQTLKAGTIFSRKGVFCPFNEDEDVNGGCQYVGPGDAATANGAFCSDPDYYWGR